MLQGKMNLPTPKNERVEEYAAGSAAREELQNTLTSLNTDPVEIPLVIGGKRVETGDIGEVRCPHDHSRVLARYHKAGEKEVGMAIQAASEAWREWSELSYRSRLSIFMRAAEMVTGKYRYHMNATTMLNLSKTPHQSEIEAVAELADFFRFNPYYADNLYQLQPFEADGLWNGTEMRPLEGFVFAVSPFNFTAIGGNLSSAPAMMGNTALWKPASSTVYANFEVMKIMEKAGLPDGVINWIPGSGSKVGNQVMRSPHLAGVHFTGSTRVFQDMWRTVGENIASYKAYPRIVGETGGKDFVVMHPSADFDAAVACLIRGAFEYQGQKCSAASRAYIPKSVWPQFKDKMTAELSDIKVGDPTNFSNFMGAVIDKASFDNIKSYIDLAKASDNCEIISGGGCDDSVGYFVEPTVVVTSDPYHRLMAEEIFGPVLTLYVYEDAQYEEILGICDKTSPYALTGSIFALDQKAIDQAYVALRHAAGNFYINDKPTGAVVGQGPFGGGRASGTNDKAGSEVNLLRWVSIRTVKENLVPPTDFRYPFMA